MTVTIIYHASVKTPDKLVGCPDGEISAAIAYRFCSRQYESVRFLADTYRKPEDYEEYPPLADYPFFRGDQLKIVDFSYPKRWLSYWESSGIQITVIDHHEFVFQELKEFSGSILNADECGATLTWQYFFSSEPMPEILEYVRQRDIDPDGSYYEGRSMRSEMINEGLGVIRHSGKTIEEKVILINDVLDGKISVNQLEEMGKPGIEKRESIITYEKCLSRAKVEEFHGYTAVILNVTEEEARYHSVLGSRLHSINRECDFAVIRFSDGGMSLRSVRSSGFDLRPLAKSLGGGGHKHACGIAASK